MVNRPTPTPTPANPNALAAREIAIAATVIAGSYLAKHATVDEASASYAWMTALARPADAQAHRVRVKVRAILALASSVGRDRALELCATQDVDALTQLAIAHGA